MTARSAAYDLAERLRVCAHDRLAATDAGAPPRSCVIAGGIAWDNCECGQLTVAITSAYPSAKFPTPSANTAAEFAQGKCGQPLLVFEMTITMLRCVPGMNDNGDPPPCDQLAESALTTVLDATAVREGVLCCLQTMLREKDALGYPIVQGFTVGVQAMVGPEGNCGGSALPVQLALIAGCPCEDD